MKKSIRDSHIIVPRVAWKKVEVQNFTNVIKIPDATKNTSTTFIWRPRFNKIYGPTRYSQFYNSTSPSSMAMASHFVSMRKGLQVVCRRKERGRDREQNYPFKVVEITPPPKNLGIRCLPSNMQCGEFVTIEGQTYTVSAVTHRYQLRKGKYEPSEKRLDVLSSGRYILNLYLDNLLEQS
ncbi:hypothetical protein Scep_017916 [Stephania cephalantha]|uniref:Uncharacterized protein n=1 Tax=Stephania cephalantha TaxID=152367 RepID=A0AAP0IRS7_9MAGN